MNKKTKQPEMFLSKGILAVLLIMVIYFACTSVSWEVRSETPNAKSLITTEDTDAPQKANILTVPIYISEIADTRTLELVNGDWPISREPETEVIVSAWPTVPVSTTDVTIHEKVLEAVSELFAAAHEACIDTLFVSSGYRDYDEQKRTYDGSPDKSFAQPPNHSEHQTGLAADIIASGVLQSKMDVSREGQWLAENAWKYGLILRYTEAKRDITGIADEPWHFRYVGQPHAEYCMQHNICFEEYIQFLKASGGYSADIEGTIYYVLYEEPKDGIIYVPEDRDFEVSSDNTGGFIVTAWE